MNLNLFDLNRLVALDALLTDCNVTRAGNRLNLSQPAIVPRGIATTLNTPALDPVPCWIAAS